MKINLTGKDKLRLSLSALGVIVGLGSMYSIADSHRNNPPPDADIGGAIIATNGLILAIISSAVLLGSVVFILARSKSKSPRTARNIALLTVGVVAIITATGWYFMFGDGSAQNSGYNKEIHNRYGLFIKYEEPVELNLAIGRQTDALSTDSASPAAPATSITIDYHNCTPGTAKVSDASGTTYVVFSGVQKDPAASRGSSRCVFYVGRQMGTQASNNTSPGGTLNTKCTWPISTILEANKVRYIVTNQGIQFGDLLGYCQDLRTGRAPADLTM